MAGIRGATGWIGVNLACTDPPALAKFYADLFGWEVNRSEPTYATVLILDPSGNATHSNLAFELDRHYRRPVWPSEPEVQQQMVHLDIGVTDLAAGRYDRKVLRPGLSWIHERSTCG